MAWNNSHTKIYFFSFILCCTLLYLGLTDQAAKASEKLDSQKIIIGTKQAPPFAFKNEAGQWDGISIQLWKIIVEDMKLDYVFKEYDLKGLLNAVENNSVDAGVAALTITAEREKFFDFTHPFHTSGLGIAVLQVKKNSWLAVFNRFFSLEFLRIVLALALLLMSVGMLVWFFERKRNQEQFGGTTLAGLIFYFIT